MRARRLACCLSLLLAAAAGAQEIAPPGRPDPVEVRNLSAAYELTNADATLRCAVALDPRAAGRGLALIYDRDLCHPRFGFLGEVSAWLPGIAGAILFVAPDGRIVTEFTEGVGGVYEAIRENDGVYFLANLQFVDPSERVQIGDLYGEWVLAPPDGERICSLTLTDEVAGDERFVLRLDADCDAGLARAGFAAWQFERGDIVLRAPDGETLRFEKGEGDAWVKVPDKPRPLTLSRP